MISAPVPAAFIRHLATTRPAPAGTVALRAALHARRKLLLKAFLVRVERDRASLTPAARSRFETDWALLERAERSDPAAVRTVLDYPMTGAWLTAALAAAEGPALEGKLAQLTGAALAAAVRAGCAVSGERAVPSGVLVLPGLGVLRCPSGRVRLSGHPGQVRIRDVAGQAEVLLARDGPGARPVGAGTGWSGLCELPGSAVVLDDLDPYRVPPHGIGPDAVPAAPRPHSTPDRWDEQWRAARALLAATDPDRMAETEAVLRAVVPLAPSGRRDDPPLTATLRAAPGAMLSRLPRDGGHLAEALVHETQHTKLAALHELVPLYLPGGARYRVGWRPDPRPVSGVLQGAYAHLALTDLWRRARAGPGATGWHARAERQFEVYGDQVGEALSILRESDELTHAGREFVQAMERHRAGLGVAARSPG
ncbi:HEXXH motif-containing putative peptide modification protein [Streptomyces sp. NPDC046942]|uniref:aKG-HExxH-type peptide beta-hydroxylase n=1 Tax=Streptomyces sp. NPDC046942 TaxID=3155137 RepID=UPI0033E8F94D